MNKIKHCNNLDELLQNCPKNQIVLDNLIRAWSKINNSKYKKIICSVSGGADSDIMVDICYKCDKDNKVEYVWFDTGLEYEATKKHLKELEKKYDISITTYKAIKPIPISCKEYGQPFLSKNVSEFISRLQRHGFDFVDKPYDELIKKYPKCQSALQWWCDEKGEGSRFSIKNNKWLKEFMVANPPLFKISNKCCKYAKKDVAHKILKENEYDLNIVGIRKAEGGARLSAYKSCFDDNGNGYDNYRPLFWYKNEDKDDYVDAFGIEYSDCYLIYGLPRTGCAGCPYGIGFEYELEVIEKYEPKLFKAVNNIFGESYNYTKKYREFAKEMNKKEMQID